MQALDRVDVERVLPGLEIHPGAQGGPCLLAASTMCCSPARPPRWVWRVDVFPGFSAATVCSGWKYGGLIWPRRPPARDEVMVAVSPVYCRFSGTFSIAGVRGAV